jgi:hypothetical protein
MALRFFLDDCWHAISDRWKNSWFWKVVYVAVGLFLLHTAMVLQWSLPVTETLVDADTGKPISNAAVLVEWYGVPQGFQIHGSLHRRCYHAEFARTDDKGRYKTRAWAAYPYGPLIIVTPDYREIHIHHPDYEIPHLQDKASSRRQLKKFTGSNSERLQQLSRVSILSCLRRSHSSQAIPFIESIRSELELMEEESRDATSWHSMRDWVQDLLTAAKTY